MDVAGETRDRLSCTSSRFILSTILFEHGHCCHIHYHIVPRPQSMSLYKTGPPRTLSRKSMRSSLVKNKYLTSHALHGSEEGSSREERGEQGIGSQTTQASFLPLPPSSSSSAPGK